MKLGTRINGASAKSPSKRYHQKQFFIHLTGNWFPFSDHYLTGSTPSSLSRSRKPNILRQTHTHINIHSRKPFLHAKPKSKLMSKSILRRRHRPSGTSQVPSMEKITQTFRLLWFETRAGLGVAREGQEKGRLPLPLWAKEKKKHNMKIK